MAQNTQSLLFVCRNCRQQINRIPSQARSFSNSASKNKSIPKFQPTASPEFDAILLDYRQKVFTPAALSEHHQRLMFRPSRSAILKQDQGVTVTMTDGEEVRLEPRNRWERPKNGATFQKISEILGNTDNQAAWWNLVPFLEGLKLAHEPAQKQFLEKVARKAGEQGIAAIAVLIQAAQKHDATGVTLALPGLTREIVLGLHNNAAAENWQGEEFEKTAKRAEHVARLLEDEKHCGGSKKDFEAKGFVDMRRNLTVVAVLLEMSAAKAVHLNGAKDVDGKVMDYVKKLVALGQDGIVDLQGNSQPRSKGPWNAMTEAENLVVLMNGIQLALRIESIAESAEGKTLQEKLDTTKKELQSRLDLVRSTASGKQRRCLEMYDAIQK